MYDVLARVTFLAALIAGCYDPELADCTVPCANDGDCATGQACGASGYCASSLVTCGTTEDDDPGSPTPPSTPATGCAATCPGACAGETCVIDCMAPGSCGEVTCPAGLDCQVLCGDDSCGRVRCDLALSCDIDCAGKNSCAEAIACGTGRCDVTCTGRHACRMGVDCDGSCACDVECSGEMTCRDAASCPFEGCESDRGCHADSGCDRCD